LYREVPEFGERRTPDELWQLVHGGQGRKILSDTMERAEANLVNSTPVGTMVTVPALNQHFGRPPTTNAFGFQTHAQIPMTQALDELKKLRATAHNTMLREQTAGSLGYDVRDLSREALDEFSSALNYLNLPADVISHWHGARSTYSRGSAIMDYLSDSQVFQGTGGMSPRLKMEGAQRTLGKDVQTGSYTQGSYYEDLLKRGVNPEFMREGILRGANPGAVDVNLPIGSSRGYHERGSVSLPLHGLLEFQRTIGRPAKVGPFNNAYPTLVDIISGAGASLLNLKQVFTP
jgi:hypothetical protein